jgi:hypothetical protein
MMDLSLMQDSQHQMQRSNVSNNSVIVDVGKVGVAMSSMQHQPLIAVDSNSQVDVTGQTTSFFTLGSQDSSSPFMRDQPPLLRHQPQQQIVADTPKPMLALSVTVGNTAAAVVARTQQSQLQQVQPAIAGVPQQRKTNLYVSSLPKHFSEGDLLQMFQRYGNVVSCMAARDAVGGCKGYGFVNFATEHSAAQAIAELHGLLLQGRMLHVRLADPRANPPPTLKQPTTHVATPTHHHQSGDHAYAHQQSCLQVSPMQHQVLAQQHQAHHVVTHQQHPQLPPPHHQQQQHYFVDQQQQQQQQPMIAPPPQHHQHVVYREQHSAVGMVDQRYQPPPSQQQYSQHPQQQQQQPQSVQFHHYSTGRRDSGDSVGSGMGGSLSALTVHPAAFHAYHQDEYYVAHHHQQQQQQQIQQQNHHHRQQFPSSAYQPPQQGHHYQQPIANHQQQQHQHLPSDLHHPATYRHAVGLSHPYPQHQQQNQQPHLLQHQHQPQQQPYQQQLMQHSGHQALLGSGDEVRYVRERTRGPSDYTYESIVS